MTDENLAGGADAPAERTPAPEEAVAPPNPVETRAPVKDEPGKDDDQADTKPAADDGEKPKKSLAESIKAADARARAKAGEADAAEKAKKEPEKSVEKKADEPPKDEKPRDESGKFAAKEQKQPAEGADKGQEQQASTDKTDTAFREAPRRFDDGAKGDWEKVPESVRGATHRTIREIEQGLERYQKAFEPYKEFDAKLKETGQSFQEVVDHYTGIEDLLRRDPMRGLDTICRNLGTSLQEVAAKVVGQSPDEARAQSDQRIHDLQSEIGHLKQQLGQVNGAVQEQTRAQIENQVAAFKAQHPRFDELEPAIAAEINAGYTLDEAYRRADLLNPAPVAPVQTRSETIQPEAEVQTLKGSKSVSGAPRSGKAPTKAKSGPSSIREAIERASARAG